jgi:dipeptidyl aminopeptidase/acylaminoacyl peptidase
MKKSLTLCLLGCFVGWLPAAERPLTGVEKRPVSIFCDGVRMAADLFSPKGLKPDQKLPALILCNGTGGTKAKVGNRTAPAFARAGFVVLSFDYRGWGESDSKLITLEAQPRPDANGNVKVEARAVRWQMNYADQTEDIRAAISFLAGEKSVDARRIGLWGSSYGGGLVTWVTANDARVRFAVAQVSGMSARGPAAEKAAQDLATKQARGEAEPVPFETGKLGGKLATYEMMRANPARGVGFNSVEAAAKIKAPMLLVDAEKDELVDIRQHGGKVAGILKANGVPVEYRIIPGITHYGVYKEKFAEVTAIETEWLLATVRSLGD